MNDEQLLAHYVAMHDPEAGPWNMSPVSLYVELEVRDYFQQRIKLHESIHVCNIGIGAGEWDDFLGYALQPLYGKLTSIDIDPEICELFQYRQKREGHPNAATVVCTDIVHHTLERESFDLLTIIGSTVNESDQYEAVWQACLSLLKQGGQLLYMDFFKYNQPETFRQLMQDNGHVITDYAVYERYEQLPFYICTVQKTGLKKGVVQA